MEDTRVLNPLGFDSCDFLANLLTQKKPINLEDNLKEHFEGTTLKVSTNIVLNAIKASGLGTVVWNGTSHRVIPKFSITTNEITSWLYE